MAMNNITLTSGMRQNLFSLQRTAKAMDVTQNRLASGKKVNSALDDPIAFFAAQGHTQRSSDLAIRKDEMSEGIQTIKAADNGISAVLDLDKIILMQYGEIVDMGNHEELLARSPLYQEIYESQLGGGITAGLEVEA